jgi:hypothetical protein
LGKSPIGWYQFNCAPFNLIDAVTNFCVPSSVDFRVVRVEAGQKLFSEPCSLFGRERSGLGG